MNVFSQLIKARLEQVSADLSESISGLIWQNTTSKKVKFHDGTEVKELIDEKTAQTLQNKTLTSPTINSPTRLEPKKDTKANLVTYATTASASELCYATDEGRLYVVKGGLLLDADNDAALVATESISSGGTITLSTHRVQNRKVQGNAGAQVASAQPFGSSVATDGVTVRLIGQDDTNTVGLTYSDTNYGVLLNGDCQLGKGQVLTLLFDLAALRWYEISRNF